MLRKSLAEAAEHNAMWRSDSSANKLATSMLDVYDSVKKAFSPDDHRHYQFTPRNLTDWVNGLQRLASGIEVGHDKVPRIPILPITFVNTLQVLDGVMFEASRIFRDRLVGEESKSIFDSIIRNVMTMQWQWRGPGGDGLLLSTLGASVEERLDSKLPPPALAQWTTDDFKELVADKLKQFEREQKDLKLLLFPEVLHRIACLDRALSMPGGSMLLCGRAGVGRRSAATLVAYIHHLELFSPAITANYDIKAFRNDLKV